MNLDLIGVWECNGITKHRNTKNKKLFTKWNDTYIQISQNIQNELYLDITGCGYSNFDKKDTPFLLFGKINVKTKCGNIIKVHLNKNTTIQNTLGYEIELNDKTFKLNGDYATGCLNLMYNIKDKDGRKIN